MRFPATLTSRATAAVLATLALSAAVPARAEPAPVVAQAVAPDTDSPAPTEPPQAGETPAPAEQAEAPKALPDRPIQFGERRRIDPFDANEDAQRTPQPGVQTGGDGVITCMAGCGRTGSTTTYRQRKEAARN